MRPPTGIGRGFPRAARAAVLLAVLFAGSLFHGWHHLQDPGCDAGFGGRSHPCTVCSGLHGSLLAAVEQPAPAPGSFERAAAAPPILPATVPPARGGVASRAPPAS